MIELFQLDLAKVKKVKVFMAHGLDMEYFCIDLGAGVWRENGDVYQAHTVRLIRHPNSPYTPKWQDIVSKEYYVSHEIKDLLPL